LRLEVSEGPRYRLTEIAIDAPTREDSTGLATLLEMAPGGWVAPAAIGAAIERAVRRAADAGHPYATLGVSALRWDSAGAKARLSGALGPEVTVSAVRIEGLKATRFSVAERGMGRLTGEPFSEAAAARARERLARLGLFRAAEYRGLESESDSRRAQLVYRVEEPRYNRFEGAVGVQGQGRPVGLASIGLDNLAGTGRAIAMRWESRGAGIAEFSAHYAEPLLFGAPLRAEMAIEQQNQDTLYTRTAWNGRLHYTLSERERVGAGFMRERVVQPRGEVQSASLQTTEFTVERDGRDLPGAPRRGVLGRVTAAQVFKRETLRDAPARKAHEGAFEALLEWHRVLRSHTGVTLELSGAGRFSSQRVLPDYERYLVGGAASLRGHDEEAFHVDRYALSRLEWRRFLGDGGQRVFLFWDHAVMGTRQILPDGAEHMDILQADGIGFGLRLDAAGGTVGVDYGLEPGRAPLEGKIHLRLITTF
jgi:outer membrane protein assembly factor BamA